MPLSRAEYIEKAKTALETRLQRERRAYDNIPATSNMKVFEQDEDESPRIVVIGVEFRDWDVPWLFQVTVYSHSYRIIRW